MVILDFYFRKNQILLIQQEIESFFFLEKFFTSDEILHQNKNDYNIARNSEKNCVE